jgi:PIN domain nuclease of toxin-antitoxin system
LKGYVVDTHALFWYISRSTRLGRNALQVFRDGENGDVRLLIPAIVLCELYYLNGKLGLPLEFSRTCDELKSAAQFEIEDLSLADIEILDSVAAVPEMHDRLIVASALRHKCPVITKDESIVASGIIETVW